MAETLDRIFWQGKQWAVTAYGIEALDGNYPIEGKRLGEDWLTHMAEKNWIDIEDFIAAFAVALVLFDQAANYKPNKFLKKIEVARVKVERNTDDKRRWPRGVAITAS